MVPESYEERRRRLLATPPSPRGGAQGRRPPDVAVEQLGPNSGLVENRPRTIGAVVSQSQVQEIPVSEESLDMSVPDQLQQEEFMDVEFEFLRESKSYGAEKIAKCKEMLAADPEGKRLDTRWVLTDEKARLVTR